jgi:TPR repeat protein
VAEAINEAKSRLPGKLSHGLKDALHRVGSGNEAVRAQAIKDLGHYFANGFAHVPEDDTFANKLYELSLEVSHGQNLQAAHDLGYQLLYGKGAAVDTTRAWELLNKSANGGHHISDPMIKYMKTHHLVPKVA